MRHSIALLTLNLLLISTAHAQAPLCGNRIVEAMETCDDGNSRSGDGCSSDCQLDDSIEMIPIKGGTYLRGNQAESYSTPVMLVSLDDFSLSRTEITVHQYKSCVDAGSCDEPDTRTYCNW